MRSAPVQTITCPKCNNSLPGWATTCQFCQTPLGNNVQRPAAVMQRQNVDKRSWQEIAYYVLAVIWILQGAYQIAKGFGVFDSFAFEMGKGSFEGIWGAIMVGLGIGMLLEQTWAQFLIKILSWITIGVGIILLPMVMLHKNPWIPLAENVWRMTLAGFQIYIINCIGDA